MKSSAKRLLSLVIVLAMALSMLPLFTFAADNTTTVYCQAPSGWSKCKAYWWGSKTGTNPSWPGVDMTKNEEGIWVYDVPSDATGLIFNNGSGTQTADLKVPTDDKVMYVFSNRQWVAPTSGPVEVVVEYFVAGSAGLCGVEWNPAADANKMTDTDKDGIYTITYTGIAAGNYEFKVTNGTWDQSWGQNGGNANYKLAVTEADTTVEIRFDSKTYQIEVVLNNKPTEPTTTESIPAGEVAYYVAGTINGWNEKDAAYKMTGADGIYTITFAVTAGDHALKVTDGTWTNSWGGNGPDGNYVFTAVEAGEVTVTFDGTTVTVTGDCLEEIIPEELVINSVHAVGAADLVGAEWDPTVNEMTGADGIYTITFENIAAGTYEFKFAANGTWDINWASGIAMESGTVYDAWFNAMGNSSVTIPADGATVTLTLDLTAMDAFTGEGAKCSVTISGVDVPVPPSPSYYVAGGFNEWNCAADGYRMTDNGDDTFSLTLSLTVGEYALKVTDGTWDNSWGGTGEGGNYEFIVVTDGEITVSFDGETVTVTGDCLGEIERDPLVIDSIHVAGSEGLVGVDWDPTANEMLNVNGVYTITFENVAAGTYEFKFVANGTWDLNWASGTAIASGEVQTAWKNALGNSSVEVAEDGSKVVLIFDSNTMDIYTGEGATMRAEVIAPSIAMDATISGKVVSGAEGEVTIELIVDGETVASVTASGKEGTYSIVEVAAGTYTLKVSQLNHVTREYTVTVGEEDLTQDVKIHLIGDIDGNGKINVGDVSKLNGHIKGSNKLTDEYMILCANVNGGKLNMGDVSVLYAHIKGTKKLY